MLIMVLNLKSEGEINKVRKSAYYVVTKEFSRKIAKKSYNSNSYLTLFFVKNSTIDALKYIRDLYFLK